MAAGPVTIRRAGPEDAPTVGRLLHDFNSEYEEETPGAAALTEYTRPLIESGEIFVFLANEADGISLWRLRTSPWTGRPEANLQELYVVPARRGRGFGRALLEATMGAAREAGASGIDLNTGETDSEARGLYESAGFTNLEGPGPDAPRMLFYEREL